MITTIYYDQNNLRHISENGDKTYCGLDTSKLTLINNVVETGTYCTTCHIGYSRSLVTDYRVRSKDSESGQGMILAALSFCTFALALAVIIAMALGASVADILRTIGGLLGL